MVPLEERTIQEKVIIKRATEYILLFHITILLFLKILKLLVIVYLRITTSHEISLTDPCGSETLTLLNSELL